MTLTDKETIFIDRYLTHFNGARAAREAGVPENRAKQYAYELKSKRYFKEALEARMKESAMDSSEALARLKAMARGETPTKTVGNVEQFDTLGALAYIGKAHALFIDRKIVDMDGLELVIIDGTE